jgi:tetratricopeptide (TPR) repeat protein
MDTPSHGRISPSPTEPPPLSEADDPLQAQASRLAALMQANWRRGQCCRAEDLLLEHPSVRANPEAAVRVIYEEVCQRQELGQEVALEELVARFPQWADELAVVLDCHRLLGLDSGPRFPNVGEVLGENRLLAELGRGGRGRVYLAEQTFLAGRLVVVKLTARADQEHLNLARLTHTHIVPLYSVRDFPERNIRALCMPCLGGATLQQVFRGLASVAPERRTGRDVLEALRTGVADARLFWPARGPNRRFLEQASYVQAVCWIGVCLADALHHAHENELVHLDVKPSNILLAADCRPMLLDFHLARDPIAPGADGSEPEWLGGTPAYMSPEQRDAWRSYRDGQPISVAVDARSDIYSLGLVLREALYGSLDGVALPARPDLSPGLRDVLARCLHPNPAARYPSAALLAEDLRCHLTHRPLVGVRNRSLRERWRKWSRRRPQTVALGLLAVTCLVAAGAVGGLYLRQVSGQLHEAEEALSQGQRQLEERLPADAVHTCNRGLAQLHGGLVGRSVRADLLDLRRRALWEQGVETLHEQIERTRYLLSDDIPPAALPELEAQCRRIWHDRQRFLTPPSAAGGTEENAHSIDPTEPVGVCRSESGLLKRAKRDLLDVAILWSHCRSRLGGGPNPGTASREALTVLDEAEALFGPSPVLGLERVGLGQKARMSDMDLMPRSAWEGYTLGRSLLRVGNLTRAADAFDRAVELRPQDFWPWFGKGLCAHRRSRYEEAVTAFSVCIALAPKRAECYHNRALVLAAMGDLPGGFRDANRALKLDPQLAPAVLNRGALYLQQQQFPEAAADFRLALTLGANPAAVHYNLALLHQARDEPAAAIDALDRALQYDPFHRSSRELRERLRKALAPGVLRP